MKYTLGSAALLALAPAAFAQVSEWGQCGGTDYTNATTCVSGNVCTEINEYYWCVEGVLGYTISFFELKCELGNAFLEQPPVLPREPLAELPAAPFLASLPPRLPQPVGR